MIGLQEDIIGENINLVIDFLLSEVKDCEDEYFGDDCKKYIIGQRLQVVVVLFRCRKQYCINFNIDHIPCW